MIGGLITIAGGLLAASGFIIRKKPNAQELIDKIAPYQGWIGMVMFGWGIWEIFGALRLTEWLSNGFALTWTFWLLCGIADLAVGFILGFGLISTYVFRGNTAAIEKGEAVRMKLLNYQIPLGFLAIIMGILYIIY
ncbi:hypothetical protein [Flavisolibacter tropicus]|uniref:Uncharacterized protein n=1 Tax=Flavisolibacter tropicus TaxID=1492898 RepID=A0A172TX53_9BACT|nr:hypothetical protein [Flavisolibacter tropicus]ANE51691.1 hypothetical protein SY85_15465 [Flavisolibacter tropicus]